MAHRQPHRPRPADDGWSYLFAAWLLALAATLTVLYVGEILGQTPCNLCWFQRAFMFPLAVVLGIAAYRADAGIWRYALPLAVAGAFVAAFHTALYVGLVPEAIEPCGRGPSCTSGDMTIAGGAPLPVLSLAVFVLIALLLLLARRGSTR
ncbi:MAG TPA: disulfide bond formation protein B [Bauldia sp.]|mgnify:CR=1 FL=1|nr:disulfide bond formation protein B [Bauldia sp.]